MSLLWPLFIVSLLWPLFIVSLLWPLFIVSLLWSLFIVTRVTVHRESALVTTSAAALAAGTKSASVHFAHLRRPAAYSLERVAHGGNDF